MFWRRARTPGPSPDLRHRQGGRRQVDRRHRARAASPRAGGCARSSPSWPARSASGRRSTAAGAPSRRSSSPTNLFTISDRSPAGHGGVPAGQDRGGRGRCSARAGCFRPSRWPRRGCASCSASASCGSWPSTSGAPTAADVYDLVIVDSPAAGHGVGILRTPRTFAEIARVGPIAHQAGAIAATIADPDFTAVIAVATAEEMPVNETLWLRDALAEEQLALEATIVNALLSAALQRARAHRAGEGAQARQAAAHRRGAGRGAVRARAHAGPARAARPAARGARPPSSSSCPTCSRRPWDGRSSTSSPIRSRPVWPR